ncbi:hypothetical protein [Flagellimonas sp.]|uniref:hypothetical protein n=1 Tax=Flagellimonas sp. TaxID=2058762 RepID=UPI003B5156BE
MKITKIMALTGLCMALQLVSCTTKAQSSKTAKAAMTNTKVQVPNPSKYVSSPVRNRIKLNLNASLPEVWEMVGKPEHMPHYSAGLEKVDALYTAGKCTKFTSHFVPMQGQTEGLKHTEKVVWYENQLGYISRSEEPNNYGYTEGLALVQVSKTEQGTLFSWDIHYNAPDDATLHMNIEAYQMALDNIAANLIKKFGGQVVESYAFKK